MMNNKVPMWNRNFILLVSINFIIMSIFYLLMVTMASYATKSFDASPSTAGLVSGIYIIGSVIGRLLTGNIINKVGSKKILIIGLSGFIITTLFYFVEINLTFLLFSRLINGFAVGIAANAVSTVVAQIIPKTRKSEGIGYFSMSLSLATAIGPFLGLLLNQHVSYQVVFSICFVLAVIALVLVWFTTLPSTVGKVQDNEKSESRKKLSVSHFIDVKALPIGIMILCLALGYASLISFISFFAEERNMTGYSSLFFIFYSVVILITRPYTGRAMDNKGSNFIVYPCIVLYFVGMFILSISSSGTLLLLAAIIIGLGYGNLFSAFQTLAIKVVEPENIGLATSTFFIFLDLSLGFGPYFLGLIVPYIGYAGLYMCLSFFILLLIIPYYFFHGKKDYLYR